MSQIPRAYDMTWMVHRDDCNEIRTVGYANARGLRMLTGKKKQDRSWVSRYDVREAPGAQGT